MPLVRIPAALAEESLTLTMQLEDDAGAAVILPPDVNIMVVFDEHADKKDTVVLQPGVAMDLGPCKDKDLKRDSLQVQSISAATDPTSYVVHLELKAGEQVLQTDLITVDSTNDLSMRRLSWSYIQEA